MRFLYVILLTISVVTAGAYHVFARVYNINSGAQVLGEGVSQEPTATLTPTPTYTPSPTPSPTLTPAPTPTLVPTVTPTPTNPPAGGPPPVTSEQIHGFIERFAGQYGVDPNVLRHIANCESGFNPLAVNGGYVGLYQFSASAWQNNRIPMGETPDPTLRYDAEESVQTAAYLFSIGKGYLWPNCQP